jgi:hypothetical protein
MLDVGLIKAGNGDSVSDAWCTLNVTTTVTGVQKCGKHNGMQLTYTFPNVTI